MRRNNEEKPVAFYSRKLQPREQRYSATELEGLAVVDSVDHFSVYLIGTEFTIEADHKALEFLKTAKIVTGRLARWALRHQPFSYKIKYHPGSKMGMQMASLTRHGIYLKLQIYLIQEMALGLHSKGRGCYAPTQYIINLYKHIHMC